ncbi:MAG: ABC transporter substrate-binding protein [Proteobacteria bacterium]|nr:ABC transporter substrate-binding protein [Pseudomonadota bacterium]
MRKKSYIFLAAVVVILTWTLTTMAAEPIKIGVPLPLSGMVAFAGLPCKNTMEMVSEDVNKDGGINGRAIEIVYIDTEAKPDVAIRGVKRLIRKDKVTAIVGLLASWCAMPSLPIIEKHKVPTVLISASSKLVEPVKKWVFKIPASDTIVVAKVLDHMKAQGIKRIAVISGQDDYSDGGHRSLVAQAPDYGINIVFDERFAGDESDLTPLINKIKKTNAQATVSWSTKRTPSIVAINYRQLGLEIPLYLGHAALGQPFLDTAGKSAEGVLIASMKFAGAEELPDSDPQKKVSLDYRNAYKKKYGKETNQFAGGAFDGLNILVAALRKAGTNNQKLRSALEQTKGFVGTQGTFTYSPDDHGGLSKDSMVMYMVVGGAWKIVK